MVSDSPNDTQLLVQDAMEERDRSFLTVNMGEILKVEVTPFLVDALHSVRSTFANEVSRN